MELANEHPGPRSTARPRPTDSDGLRRRGNRTNGRPSSTDDFQSRSKDPVQSVSNGHGTSINQLWLRSRRQSDYSGLVNPPGHDRVLSLQNISLAFKLIPLIWLQLISLFWQGRALRMSFYVFGKFAKGTLPAFRIWANAQLLDQVQESLKGGSADGDVGVDEAKVLRLAVISLIAASSQTIFRALNERNELVVRNRLVHQVEKMYMSVQLSLDIPTISNPHISALMYEAGCFAGFEKRQTRTGQRGGTPLFFTINRLFGVLTSSVEVISAGALLTRTLRTAMSSMKDKTPSPAAKKFYFLEVTSQYIDLPSQSTVLIALCFLPAILSMAETFVTLTLNPSGQKAVGSKSKASRLLSLLTTAFTRRKGRAQGDRFSWHENRRAIENIKELGRNGAYKQEVILFDMKDWIIDKWDGLREKQMTEEMERTEGVAFWKLWFGLAEESVQTTFYALLALRSFGTSISLGSIRLYQSAADSLMRSVRNLTRDAEEAVQLVFYMSAFFEMQEVKRILDERGRSGLHAITGIARAGPAKAPGADQLVDYEETRPPGGGMRIEARNLGFAFPGSKPVLHDITLTIEAGSTVAIVGFNGGGKTTLVKVLMGLYDHTGELLVNGHPIKAYNPQQLHARATAAFQDFNKYNLTLRENIGIGYISQMSSEDAIDGAITRGGAEAIKERFGLDALLDRSGVPDVGGGNDLDSNITDGPLDDIQEAGPPPDFPPLGSRPDKGLRGRYAGHEGPRTGGPAEQPPGPPPISGERMGHGYGGTEGSKNRVALSGGQWQRIALAKAFMRADVADLVVFDEPSAALDARAEAELFKRIHGLSRQKSGRKPTTIFTSHRFATVRRADVIIVVENGTILEMGDHEALLAKRGRYQELFELQREGLE